MIRRCPKCGRVYERSLKRYCSRCHAELVEGTFEEPAPPEEDDDPTEDVPAPPRELSLRARAYGALFALLLLFVISLDLVFLTSDSSIPLLVVLAANAVPAAAITAVLYRRRRG